MRAAALSLALVALLAFGASASSEVIQRGHFRVAVDAELRPNRLPRSGQAPIRFSLRARFIAEDGDLPPRLKRITIAINRHGRLDTRGLPVCGIDQIQPSTTADALSACRRSLIGEGYSAAHVRFTAQSPFPSDGRLLAFNGRWQGRPAILVHIYGPKPAPTSVTIPFAISRIARGTFGTKLSASLPAFSSRWGYLTEISMTLGRRFSYQGVPHSYLSAGCPTPPSVPIVSFPLSRASFAFAGDRAVKTTLMRSCRARR